VTVQIRVFMSRLRELFGQRPFDGELEVEIHLHVQMLKSGETPVWEHNFAEREPLRSTYLSSVCHLRARPALWPASTAAKSHSDVRGLASLGLCIRANTAIFAAEKQVFV
jgi:hypothetical protein